MEARRGIAPVARRDVADLPPGIELITARAINDRGQIVCTAFDQHAYLLTPIRRAGGVGCIPAQRGDT